MTTSDSNTAMSDEQLIEMCEKAINTTHLHIDAHSHKINQRTIDQLILLKRNLSELLSRFQKAQKENDAIAFGEWLRTFTPLDKQNGQWVLESQISTEKLYQAFKRDSRTTDRDSIVEKCVEALAKQFAIDYSYDAKICVWKGPYTESIRTALRTVLNPEG